MEAAVDADPFSHSIAVRRTGVALNLLNITEAIGQQNSEIPITCCSTLDSLLF